jgi:hypothetical protein
MPITIVEDVFSPKQIEHIYKAVAESEKTIDTELGRVKVDSMMHGISELAGVKLRSIVRDVTDLPLSIGGATYVEYNLKYGKPDLPPHFDGDNSDLIINIQLESNTQWDIGLNQETYTLKDNSALIFNPNKEIHWRVHKTFRDGDYVRMLFVRLVNLKDTSDYSHLNLYQGDKVFRDSIKFRNSLGVF